MPRTNEGDWDTAVAAARFIAEKGLMDEFHRAFNRLLAPEREIPEMPENTVVLSGREVLVVLGALMRDSEKFSTSRNLYQVEGMSQAAQAMDEHLDRLDSIIRRLRTVESNTRLLRKES